MDHPKFTLIYDNNSFTPYQIMEFIPCKEGVLSRVHSSFQSFDEAVYSLGYLCKKPIILAISEDKMDGVFEV